MIKVPKLNDLSNRVRNLFRTELPGTDPWVWPNNLYVVAKVLAALTYELFLRLRWIGDQAFITTADAEMLPRHAEDYDMAMLPATHAEGIVQVTGAIVLAPYTTGQLIARNDGRQYQVVSDGVVDASGMAQIPIRAVETGADANSIEQTPFTPVNFDLGEGVEYRATDNGIVGGTDGETIENFRARLLQRKRFAPALGSPPDFVRWVGEFPGVTRVWVRRAQPRPGMVSIIFMMEDIYPDGRPLPGDIVNLQNHLDTLAPARAGIHVSGPSIKVVDIHAIRVSPLTTQVIEAVNAELKETFRTRADLGKTFSRSWISQAIANASGENSHVLNSPASDIDVRPGQIVVLGRVTLQ